MIVTAESLCMGCMEPKSKGLCRNPDTCGWLEGSPNESPLQLPPRTRLNKRYLVGKALGQGGLGITYLSCNLDNFSRLAVKEYFPRSFATRTTDQHTVTHSSPDNRTPYEYGLNKFIQEAKTLERLRGHANIVSVIEFFPENNTAYIVMEYLDGVTLEKYLRDQGGKISFDHSLQILLPVMDALREVHATKMAHRDVSPDNIILTKSNQIKLIDFGAAKQTIQGQRTQQLILKPGYTPEEQYRSDAVAGPGTDVYATGATFYRCITGVVPPEAPGRMFEDTLLAPGKMGAKLPRHGDRAIMRALAVRAKDRYQNIQEFQGDLTQPDIARQDPESDNPKRLSFGTTPPTIPPTKNFRVWWIVGLLAIVIGSFCDLPWKLPILLLGLIAVAGGGQTIKRLNNIRNDGARHEPDTRPNLLLLLAIFSCLIVGPVSFPYALCGLIALVPAIFVGMSLSREAKLPEKLITVKPPDRRELGLRFDAGDLIGETVDVGSDPITIGRDPAVSNLIIRAAQVSGAHVKVWRDESGGLNVQDIGSRNGTYFSRSPGNGKWERLVRVEILFAGDSFYLSEPSTALFEVVKL